MDKQLLKDLATFRELVFSSNANLENLQRKLEETDQYQNIQKVKSTRDEYQTKVNEITTKIKSEGLAEYLATKEKPSLAGLSLRINKFLKYDLEKVTEWAKENAKMLFVLDVKAFEKLAKNSPVPGVETIDDPMITIASDLSEYLK